MIKTHLSLSDLLDGIHMKDRKNRNYLKVVLILFGICLLGSVIVSSGIIPAEKKPAANETITGKVKNTTIFKSNTTITEKIPSKIRTQPTGKATPVLKPGTTNVRNLSNSTKTLNTTVLPTMPPLSFPLTHLSPPGWETFGGLAKGCDAGCSGASGLIH